MAISRTGKVVRVELFERTINYATGQKEKVLKVDINFTKDGGGVTFYLNPDTFTHINLLGKEINVKADWIDEQASLFSANERVIKELEAAEFEEERIKLGE